MNTAPLNQPLLLTGAVVCAPARAALANPPTRYGAYMSFRVLGLLAVLLVPGGSAPLAAQRTTPPARGPIIDVHFHAGPGSDSAWRAPPPNPVTGAVPPWRNQAEFVAAAFDTLAHYGIVRAVVDGLLDEVARWHRLDPVRIVPAVWTLPGYPLPSVDRLRQEMRAGRVRVLGELGLQYLGMSPDDPRMEPYYALAEELDVPVAIHVGPGPSARVPAANRPLGNPLLLAPVLDRHPRIRLYLMHGVSSYTPQAIELMRRYPSVYADLARQTWTGPRDTAYVRLRALMDAGLGKRLMFGSDVGASLDAIAFAIERIESAPFLSAAEKRDIFYCNAVRFFRFQGLSCP